MMREGYSFFKEGVRNMKWVFIILLFLYMFGSAFVFWCCCKVAGEADERMRILEEREDRKE